MKSLIKIRMLFFTEKEYSPKIQMEAQRPQIAKAILNKKQ